MIRSGQLSSTKRVLDRDKRALAKYPQNRSRLNPERKLRQPPSRPRCPATTTGKNVTTPNGDSGPNIFADPETAFDGFRRSLPGEAGMRNTIRGDGYFGLDIAVGKSFNMPTEGHRLVFRWEVFNLTNTPSFDVGSLNGNLGSIGVFGSYTNVLGPADSAARVMQVALRYEF